MSPFSETKLYAAEAGEAVMTGETTVETESEPTTENNTENATEGESASESETENKSESAFVELETESSTEEENASETESAVENRAENITESESEYPCPVELEPENIPYDENQEEFTDKLVNSKRTRSVLPARYDAREEGYLPAVRNQGRWGACWSFSIIGALEVSMIRDIGIAADKADLSERHLAYFGYNTGYDALDNANGDTMTHSPDGYYLTHGGNDIRGVIRLMNWNGGAEETDYPYLTNALPDALERTAAQNTSVYLENAYSYNFANAADKDEAINVIKKMITDYGAVSWSYYNASQYLNSATGAYYNNAGGSGTAKTNHAIMAVGWDDSYAKENFREDIQPENDGAWIIRNSWGESSGDDGYYYMSYEDASLGSGNSAYAYTVCDALKYDNNYFYGNTAFSTSSIAVRRAAQIYQMKSENAVREKLTAVSFLIGTSDVNYELQIYKNPDMKDGIVTNPTSGTPMLDIPQTGTTSYPGLHTIELDTPVAFDADDYAAIVLTFPDTKPNMYFDRSYTSVSSDGKCEGVHVIAEGQSFYGSSLTSWTDDYKNNRTFRINALTVDCDDVVEIPEIKGIEVMEAQGFDEFPKVNIRWSKCTGADGYRLYRAEDGADYELICTADSSVRSYTDIFPERKAAECYYKVEAVYGDTAKASEAVSERIAGAVEAPELTLSAYDGYEAVFTWDRIGGADSYELWRLSDGESGEYVHVADFAAEDALSYAVDTDGWELGNYFYKLRARHDSEYTNWSETYIKRDLIWSQDNYYRASFEWLPVENAVSYKLLHRVNGKLYAVKTANTYVSVSMNSKNYLPCDEHQYYIVAYDEADAGGNVVYTSSTIVFRMLPDALSLESTEYDYGNAVTLAWSGGEGADEVEVCRSENPSEKGECIAVVDAQAACYTDIVYKGKNYYYSLTPIAADSNKERIEGETIVSEGVSTLPEAVVLEKAQYIENEGVSLAWTAAKGAEGYVIERSDNNDEFSVLTVIESGDKNVYTDNAADRGNIYQYRILSYFAAEDGSRAVVSALNAMKVEVFPAPVELSEITELKREKDKTRVALSWNAEEKAQSYAIYRSVISAGEAGSYDCIAENITQGQYIDITAASDTSYSYKLIVTVNGLDSELEKTADKTITTKPILTSLNVSAESVGLVRDAEQELRIVPTPAHYPYEQELVWSACDEAGNALAITQKNDTLVINGVDGKEVLYLSDGKIHAVCDSETVNVILTAAIDEINTKCTIFVYDNGFWVRGVKDLTYTGRPLTQNIEVYDKNRLLTEGVDYTVAYKNNVKVSTDVTKESKKPAVIVKGKGSYTGTQTVYFEILPEADADVEKRSVFKTKVKSIGVLAFAGQAAEPKPIVRDGNKTLTEGTDYKLSYENNDTPGNAAVIISGINGYKGTKRVSFKIQYNIQDDKNELMNIRLESDKVPYAKGGSKPSPQVYCGGRLLKEGTDYKLSYKNNKTIAAASAPKAPTVIITGKGSFKGKRELTFDIIKQNIGELTLTAKDKLYTGKPGSFYTSFVITDADGRKLSAGKDYDKASVTYTYADTGKPVGKTDIVQPKTILCITVNAAQAGAYSGTISGEYRIAEYDIAKVRSTAEAQIFTGSAIEPDSKTGLTVSYKGGELAEGVDYIITGYENNVKKGTAKLYIKGIGDFCGTKTVTFKIKTRIFKWWWEN